MKQVLSEDLSPMQKEQVASKMLEGKYIRKLLDIFGVTLLCLCIPSCTLHGCECQLAVQFEGNCMLLE